MSERARALEQARETALRTDAAYLSPSGRIVRVQGHKLTGRVIVDSRGRVAVRNVDTDRLSYVHEADLRELAVDPPPSGASYQQGVREWVVDCFGPTIADDKAERCFRFLEEALELVQSVGATREQAARLVEYVYERPVGQPGQEVGGVMVTLAALVSAVGIDMQAEAERELKRISAHDVREKIRRKQASKPVAVIGSPDAVLPQPSGASPQEPRREHTDACQDNFDRLTIGRPAIEQACICASQEPTAEASPQADTTCEHGTAMDVHCCNCHSGFIFDVNHECPSPELTWREAVEQALGVENDPENHTPSWAFDVVRAAREIGNAPTPASPQAEELRAANVANLREMVVMAGRHRETLLAVRECILALSPGHRTGYDWNADPLFLTLKEGRALNLIDDALKSTPASPQAETREDMGEGWFVTVGRFGASFVTLEETHMGGKPYFTPEDKALVRGAALHLLAFIGSPAPASPVEPEPPTLEPCAHELDYHNCAECVGPKVEPEPCVWRITSGPLGTWVKPTCVEGSIPAPWGTERAKACHLCGAPLKVER